MARILIIFPQHPKRNQNLKFTILSETTSILTFFIFKSPPPPLPRPSGAVPLLFMSELHIKCRKSVDYWNWEENEVNTEPSSRRILCIVPEFLALSNRLYPQKIKLYFAKFSLNKVTTIGSRAIFASFASKITCIPLVCHDYISTGICLEVPYAFNPRFTKLQTVASDLKR